MDNPREWLSWKTLLSWKTVLGFLIVIGGFALGYYTQTYFNRRGSTRQPTAITDANPAPADQNQDPYIIDFSSQGLDQFPAFLLERPEITDLILSFNDIPSIPDGLAGLAKLRVLDLRYNSISGPLTGDIGQLPLVDLNVSNNQLTAIPPDIGQLNSLRYADFSHNQLTDVPDQVTQLQNLKWLNLAANPIDLETIAELRQRMPSTIVNY